jgi:hypothetical protein
MPHETSSSGQSAVHALRYDLRQADDKKIRQITAMLDEVSDATVNQVILDPLRSRLGSLKPVRPLRFVRLLLTPLDPLIVPASKWRPGEGTVPRTVLAAISRIVQSGLGREASVIDKMISGHKTDATQVITLAGEALWQRAAEILAVSPPPADWPETGLRATSYPPLAQAIAAVFRRASQLRCLLRDGEVAALETDQAAIDDILRNIANESAEGCAMIVQLILLQSPHAAARLRQFVASRQDMAEKAMLGHALACGTEQALTQMESPAGVINEINGAPLAGIGDQVRRITTFLREIGHDTGAAGHRGRLKAITQKLDQACRARFADGIAQGLVLPLTVAADRVDGARQTQMETCARDLRTFETMARKVGGSGSYDQLLLQASETVLAAAVAGTLTPVRKLRLIEILSGPEVAAAMYKRDMTAV